MKISKIQQVLRNVRQKIEHEQKAPLSLSQACTIYDICDALGIDPFSVLAPQTIALIDPLTADLQMELNLTLDPE